MSLTKYYFEAVSRDGKNLSGFLFSENIASAREKLKQDGHAVLTIEPYVEKAQEEKNTITFEFKGTPPHGKTVRGEIESESEYDAYKKLRLDYEFQLDYLIQKSLPFEQKELLKKKGVDPELEQIFQEDKKTEIDKKKKKVEEKKKDKIEMMLDRRRKEMIFLQESIKSAIDQVQLLLDENNDYLDFNKKREIQERIDRLSRLRQSSSVKHLEGMMRRLFEQLGNDDIFQPVSDKFPDMEARKMKFRDLSGTLKGSLNKGLASIQITDSDIEKLRAVIQLRPLQKIFSIIYWGFVFLFLMMLNFWLLNLILPLFGFNIEKANFYFHSPTLWFITGISGVISLLFSFEEFSVEPFTWKAKSILYSIAFVSIVVFTIQFPVFFFWTM